MSVNPALTQRLHPDDLAAIADRVCSELSARLCADVLAALSGESARGSARMLTATEVAERLGVSRDQVYRMAHELGAARLGDGPKARLRFDPEKVAGALSSRSGSKGSLPPSTPQRRRSRHPTPRTTATGIPLLPVGAL